MRRIRARSEVQFWDIEFATAAILLAVNAVTYWYSADLRVVCEDCLEVMDGVLREERNVGLGKYYSSALLTGHTW